MTVRGMLENALVSNYRGIIERMSPEEMVLAVRILSGWIRLSNSNSNEIPPASQNSMRTLRTFIVGNLLDKYSIHTIIFNGKPTKFFDRRTGRSVFRDTEG